MLTGLGNVLFERLELLHEDLDLVAELGDIRHGLVILCLLGFCLLDNSTDAVLELALELLFDLPHLGLMSPHLFLVMLLMLAILFDLRLDLLPDILVTLDFLSARLSQLIDLLSHFRHALLEIISQIGPQLPLLVKHRLVLQVKVVILLEDGGAEKFESFPLLDRALEIIVELLANRQLLLTLSVH